MAIREFSFEPVTLEMAKQDKIDLVYGPLYINSTTEDIDAIREYISVPPIEIRNDPSMTEAYGTLFLRSQEHQNIRRDLKIRSNPMRIGGRTKLPPLFTGGWIFSKYAVANAEKPVQTTTRFELKLNPTRYVRYQDLPGMAQMSDPRLWPKRRIFARQQASQFDDEFSLDGSDNWIPNSSLHDAFVAPAQWQQHLSNYLNAVQRVLHRRFWLVIGMHPDIDRVIDVDSITHRLRSVETYFEFSAENPSLIVDGLKKLLSSFTRGLRETREYEPLTTDGVTHNSRSISAVIDVGRKIRIYAKTNKRIRVEVIHTLGSDKFRLPGGHSANNTEGVKGMLLQTSEDATELVNRMFEHFRNLNSVEPSHISSFDLLMLICQSAENAKAAKTMASLLVSIGAIAGGKCPKAMSQSLYTLRELGILVVVSRNIYAVAAPYRHAVLMLSRPGLLSTLIGRQRTR